MIRFGLVAALLASVALTPAMAKDNDKDAPVAADKKVCKRDVKTGSIMPRPVCRTRAEWDDMTARSQADKDRINDMDRSRSMTPGMRPGG